ncbi:hypothetical protein F383_10625 [Gossypium arboreum]|uniref:Uncharacterized protein n=1 Tax=Gossypium arboreum TaxID=29729 RepID=A0A0B0N8Y8_GOSAR|nr:hypothetical protein F383_10625 [Gossypium arboreum]
MNCIKLMLNLHV